jgi:short-subunit dehydrogenase
MNKIALITGATSGIGKACAEKFASEGFNIIITGRRADRLSELKQSLMDAYRVEVMELCFDVQDRNAVETAIATIPDDWQQIAVLINNAGLSLGRDSFENAKIEDWETMMQTNVNGLLYVTKALMPIIIQNKSQIINVGSIAGKEVYENGNVYCASKFAVDAISKSMRIDLMKYGVRVTTIHPGAVETEFSLVRFKGDQNKADAVYKGFKPLIGADVAQTVYYATTLPSHVCLNEITIMPTQQASAFYFHKEN